MADFPRCIARSAEDLPIDDESSPHARPEGKKNQVSEVGPGLAHSEMKLGERSCIAVMFDHHRYPWKNLHEPRFQRHVMPSGQMRRVEQKPFLNPERSADRHADGPDSPARALRRVYQFSAMFDDCGECRSKRLDCSRRNLNSLEDCAIQRAFHARRLGAANIKTENSAPARLHTIHQCAHNFPAPKRSPAVRRNSTIHGRPNEV